MNVVFPMLINCPWKIGYQLWCKYVIPETCWSRTIYLKLSIHVMHMKTLHGVYTLLEAVILWTWKMTSQVLYVSLTCLFLLIELKQTCESPSNWRWSIDSLPLGSIMCIFVNRRKGPSTNTQTNIHTYRTELNNLKLLPAWLAFLNMMAPACYMWTELQLRYSSVIARILGWFPWCLYEYMYLSMLRSTHSVPK
jgi:hypothetical protein